MRPVALIALSLGVALSLSACSHNDGPYAGKTTNWFKAHQKEMKAQLHWCDNQGAQKDTQDHTCVAASNAANELQNEQINKGLQNLQNYAKKLVKDAQSK